MSRYELQVQLDKFNKAFDRLPATVKDNEELYAYVYAQALMLRNDISSFLTDMNSPYIPVWGYPVAHKLSADQQALDGCIKVLEQLKNPNCPSAFKEAVQNNQDINEKFERENSNFKFAQKVSLSLTGISFGALIVTGIIATSLAVLLWPVAIITMATVCLAVVCACLHSFDNTKQKLYENRLELFCDIDKKFPATDEQVSNPGQDSKDGIEPVAKETPVPVSARTRLFADIPESVDDAESERRLLSFEDIPESVDDAKSERRSLSF